MLLSIAQGHFLPDARKGGYRPSRSQEQCAVNAQEPEVVKLEDESQQEQVEPGGQP